MKTVSRLLCLLCAFGWLIFASPARAALVSHSIDPGTTKGEAITANGDIHQFRANLTKADPPDSRVVNGTTYWKVVEDANHYYSATVQWVLPANLTGHPAWAQTSEIGRFHADLATTFEITTQNPGVLQNTLGYLITVKGKRIAVGGAGGGAGGGVVVEEDWGSSFTGQAIENFNPSSEETLDNATKTVLGSGTVAINGTATVGQKADLSYYSYSYTLEVESANHPKSVIASAQNQSAPIIHGSLGKWNVDELNDDGTRRYAAGDYTVTLTVTAGADGGAGGTATASVTIVPQQVTFSGLARSCAGGVLKHDDTLNADVADGVHDFTITALAKDGDAVLANTPLKFAFFNNRGHDFTNDDWKPNGWTAAQTRRAKFITTAADGTQSFAETMTATSDANGQVSVQVLSSDIVSSDIAIQAIRTNAQGTDRVVGTQNCDFAAIISYRRFANQYDPNETADTGWLFDFPNFGTPDRITPAKVYIKCMKDLALLDVDGNWNFVNGHWLRIKVIGVVFAGSNETTWGTPEELQHYATVLNSSANNTQPATDIVQTGQHPNVDGVRDGAASSQVQAGPDIGDVDAVIIGADELTQWDG